MRRSISVHLGLTPARKAWAFERALWFHGEVTHRAHAIFVGLWLGLLDDDALGALTERYYDRHERLESGAALSQGLRAWEQAVVDEYFNGRREILVVGAGSGRETIALTQQGFVVDAFDCNQRLVAIANDTLARCGLPARQRVVPPNECPSVAKSYDGAIVGWCAYMHIAGRSRRIRFLTAMRQQLKPSAPLLVSFRTRRGDGVYERRVWRLAATIRRIVRRPLPEVGDDIERAFAHYFSPEEASQEVESAGYSVVHRGSAETTYLVARPSGGDTVRDGQ